MSTLASLRSLKNASKNPFFHPPKPQVFFMIVSVGQGRISRARDPSTIMLEQLVSFSPGENPEPDVHGLKALDKMWGDRMIVLEGFVARSLFKGSSRGGRTGLFLLLMLRLQRHCLLAQWICLEYHTAYLSPLPKVRSSPMLPYG